MTPLIPRRVPATLSLDAFERKIHEAQYLAQRRQLQHSLPATEPKPVAAGGMPSSADEGRHDERVKERKKQQGAPQVLRGKGIVLLDHDSSDDDDDDADEGEARG